MTEPQTYEYTEDRRELPEGDYVLKDGAGWFSVNGLSVRIKATDEGVVVDIYPEGKEDEDSIASTYAFSNEEKEEV